MYKLIPIKSTLHFFEQFCDYALHDRGCENAPLRGRHTDCVVPALQIYNIANTFLRKKEPKRLKS